MIHRRISNSTICFVNNVALTGLEFRAGDALVRRRRVLVGGFVGTEAGIGTAPFTGGRMLGKCLWMPQVYTNRPKKRCLGNEVSVHNVIEVHAMLKYQLSRMGHQYHGPGRKPLVEKGNSLLKSSTGEVALRVVSKWRGGGT
jgi:hypothetical protein